MAKPVVLELNAAAVEALESLMMTYGEETPEAMVSRALGLMQVMRRYIDHGVLKIEEPKSGKLLEFYFENYPELPESARGAAYAET